jgi:hypothetical protein
MMKPISTAIGNRPHFSNGKFRLMQGLKRDVDYHIAAWLQLQTKWDDNTNRREPQTAEQKAAIAEIVMRLRELAVKLGFNQQLQLGISIKEKSADGETWPVIERPLMFLDVPQDFKMAALENQDEDSGNYERPSF